MVSGKNPLEFQIDDDAICVGYARKLEVENELVEDDLFNDHVKLTLLIARLKALEKFEERWG